jgi:hypothetical protein
MGRGMHRTFALLIVAAVPVAAQPKLVSVRGIAWDSLRAAPLPGAVISVTGTGRTVVSDPRGRFQVDSVPAGTHSFVMSHDAVDSVGFAALPTRVEVTDGRAEVRLAIPSFQAFWAAGCRGKAPKDSSLVYGVVRRSGTGGAVRGAKVELAWLDLSTRRGREVQQKVNRLETTTDSVGNYGFCGVPNGQGFRVRASIDSGMSGIIDMSPREDRVRWRDLTIGMLGQASGIVAGTVVRGTGQPFPDALVSLEEAGETRTDAEGRFSFPKVAPGTRQLQVQAVGLDPVLRTIDVAPNDTAQAFVNLDRVTTLNSVRVTSTPFSARIAAGIGERRTMGLGTFVDSNAIKGVPLLRSALSTIASVHLMPTAGSGMSIARQREPLITMGASYCRPAVFLDGIDQMGQESIWMLAPDDIALFEVYPRASLIPVEFQSATKAGCVLVVWTKRALRRR